VYVGNDLKTQSLVIGNQPPSSHTAYIHSAPLVGGQVVKFWLRLGQLDTSTTLYVYVVDVNFNSGAGSIVWWTSVVIAAGLPQIYSLPVNGPVVKKGLHFGWMFDGYNPLYYTDSSVSGVQTYKATVPQLPPQVQSSVNAEQLPCPCVYSIGVVIEQSGVNVGDIGGV